MEQRLGDVDALAELAEQVLEWRRTRSKQRPMPEPLWAAAVRLARRLGVNPVKEALGLNYGTLRARVEAVEGAAADTTFVEFSGAQVLGTPAVAASAVMLELTDAHGARLTVRIEGGASFDLSGVVAAFRGGRG